MAPHSLVGWQRFGGSCLCIHGRTGSANKEMLYPREHVYALNELAKFVNESARKMSVMPRSHIMSWQLIRSTRH